MRLIDADAVVTIQTYDDMFEVWGTEKMTVAEAMDKWSDEGCPPTVDAELVRHGRWRHLGGDEWCCTVCGEVIYTEGSWEKPTHKYCHECGAKMDGKRK